MADYHVGCGAFAIYAGILSKQRKDGLQLWKNKSVVTTEAIESVAEYLLITGTEMRFTHQGKRYVLSVQEGEDDATD